jgi:hypothetical protein
MNCDVNTLRKAGLSLAQLTRARSMIAFHSVFAEESGRRAKPRA